MMNMQAEERRKRAGMKTIRIPHASNKRWLTLFYAMPRELVGKVQTYLDFPRCPYEVLRTDKYDRLINDDMFLELIWDCTAWAVWQYIEVPYPGSGLNPDQEYIGWSWILLQTEEGQWELITWGY